MKRLTIAALCGSILGGCVGTRVKVSTDQIEVTVDRLALLYWASVPGLYGGGPDGDAIRAAVDAAVKAGLEGAK
jgi:hypothetical protein